MKKEKKKTRSINLRVSAKEKKRIDKLAAHYDCSVSYLIRHLLWVRANELEIEP